MNPIKPSNDLASTSAATRTGEPLYFGLAQTAWIKIGTVTALFVWLFWKGSLHRLWAKTNPFDGEENWQHAPLIPLIGLYYLYINREQLRPSMVKPTWWGLFIMVGGILLFTYGIWPGKNDWVKDVGMVVTLFGLVTLLCGWEIMKTAWFPIAFLICGLPWPGLFYSLIASPLQYSAAVVAVHLLNLFGVQSLHQGTKIFVQGIDGLTHTLNVAEACSGLKSLMTFVMVAGAVAFLSVRPLWQKLIMVLSAIPIAIFCNTMRVTVQGVLARYWDMQWAENFAHGLVGLVMMIPAFFMIMGVGWLLQRIFSHQALDKQSLKQGYITVRRPGFPVSNVKASPGVRVGINRPQDRTPQPTNLSNPGTNP